MEFVRHRTFEHPNVSQPRTNAATQNKFTAYCHVMGQEQYLFAGLTSGRIFYYKKKGINNRYLVQSGKELERVELTSPLAHKGEIKKLIHTNI